MKITLNWVNRNANADGHRIYRSVSPIGDTLPPDPVVTVPGGSTQWIDTNVTRGKTYYYRIVTFKGADVAVSTEIQATALPHSGPGPAELQYGDYEAGYFGVLEAHELVSGPELKALTGHQHNVGSPSQTWAKVAHKGKILYIAIGNGFGYMSWLNLYQSGLIYGTDDHGPAEAVAANGGVGVNQLKTFDKFGSTFKVRLLQGLPEGPYEGYTGPNVDHRPVGLDSSEFNDVMLRMGFGIYEGRHGIIIPEVEPATITGPTHQWGTTLCQEILDNRAVARGMYNYVAGGAYPTFGVATTAPLNAVSATSIGSTTYCTWRPVLELMDN